MVEKVGNCKLLTPYQTQRRTSNDHVRTLLPAANWICDRISSPGINGSFSTDCGIVVDLSWMTRLSLHPTNKTISPKAGRMSPDWKNIVMSSRWRQELEISKSHSLRNEHSDLPPGHPPFVVVGSQFGSIPRIDL